MDEIKQPYNMIQRFNLECDPMMRQKFAYIGMLYNLGMVVGAAIIGYILDRIGRKKTILIGAVCVTLGLFGV